jgi:hypothetical protein
MLDPSDGEFMVNDIWCFFPGKTPFSGLDYMQGLVAGPGLLIAVRVRIIHKPHSK